LTEAYIDDRPMPTSLAACSTPSVDVRRADDDDRQVILGLISELGYDLDKRSSRRRGMRSCGAMASRDGSDDSAGLPARAVVRAGYDLVSTVYEDDAGGQGTALRRPWLRRLRELVRPGGLLLDFGCGAGVPVARDLARDDRVVGLDVSGVQLERARRLVPDAAFVQADVSTAAFRDGVFDAVVCLYTLIHVPVDDHRAVLARIGSWLRPGGVLMIITGHTATDGVEHDWLGVPGATMYWSHADWATYQRWFDELGYDLLHDEFVAEGDGGHHLAVARTPLEHNASRT
jgi:SAM-dependent methyltransferase